MKTATRVSNHGWVIRPVQVEVLATNGGWTTIREIGQSWTEKVRNGELVDHRETETPDAYPAQCATNT